MAHTRHLFAALTVVVLLLTIGSGVAQAQTVLVTGANSGIGLEFTKQYLARGWTVIWTAPATPGTVLFHAAANAADKDEAARGDYIYTAAATSRSQ